MWHMPFKLFSAGGLSNPHQRKSARKSWGMRVLSGQREGLLTHCTLVFGWKARIILGTQTGALLAFWVIIPLSWSLLLCLESCICTTSAQESWPCDRYLKFLPWNKTALIETSQRQGTVIECWVLKLATYSQPTFYLYQLYDKNSGALHLHWNPCPELSVLMQKHIWWSQHWQAFTPHTLN